MSNGRKTPGQRLRSDALRQNVVRNWPCFLPAKRLALYADRYDDQAIHSQTGNRLPAEKCASAKNGETVLVWQWRWGYKVIK